MATSTGLAMSWDKWHKHDALALAGRVRAKELAAKELSAQAAEAVERLDPVIEAVLGIYEDAVADPDKDGPSKTGQLYGVPMLLKDLGSGLAGRTQESGFRLFRDHVVKATDPLVANYLRTGLVPLGRSTTPEFGMTFDHDDRLPRPGQSDAQSLEPGANTGRLLGRLSRGSRRRGGADQHVLRRRWVDRHSGRILRYDKFDIWKMLADNNTVTREFGRPMERFDLLLVPTTAVRVPKAGGPSSLLRDEELDPWLDRLCDACRCTMPANETGLPGLSLTAGVDRGGLPIGVQFYGNFCREDLLLQIAAQIERARPEWLGAVPGVHVGTVN